jgi:hypothetical protein
MHATDIFFKEKNFKLYEGWLDITWLILQVKKKLVKT